MWKALGMSTGQYKWDIQDSDGELAGLTVGDSGQEETGDKDTSKDL